MKIIKNRRRKKWLKYKIKIKSRYKKKLDEEIDKLQKEYQQDIIKVTKRYEERIQVKDTQMEQEINVIREQEKNYWIPVVHEREKEIQRLRSYIDNQKEFYESVKNREYQLEEITKKTINRVQRGLDQITEGVQTVYFAQGGVEYYNKKQIKKDQKQQLKES